MTASIQGGVHRIVVRGVTLVVMLGLAALIIFLVMRNAAQPSGELDHTPADASPLSDAVQAPVQFPPAIPEDAEVHSYAGRVVRLDENGTGFTLETSRGQKHILVTSTTDIQEEVVPSPEERRVAAEKGTILSASTRVFTGPILLGATARVTSLENISGLVEFTASKVVIVREG